MTLAYQTMMVDKGTQGTDASDANVHGMLGTENGKMQSPAQGRTAIEAILNTAPLQVRLHAAQDIAARLEMGELFKSPRLPGHKLIMFGLSRL